MFCTMADLSLQKLNDYRASTFQLNLKDRVKQIDQAVDFVNRRGFVFFWPIKEVTMPSLWAAVAGDRPVPNNHDDPGHVTWGWKDSLLGKKRWFYAKILRKRATILSLDAFPYFYALSENYGSPEEDHLILYEQGRLSAEAKAVYEAVLDEGPLDALQLRRAARLTNKESTSRFNRALVELQADFKLMPIGVAQAGAWNYAFIYEIVVRHHPEVLDQARFLTDQQARRHLVQLFFHSIGAAGAREVTRLFGWRPPVVRKVLEEFVEQGELISDVRLENEPKPVYVLPTLLA